MDEDGDAQFAALGPDGVEPGVVDLDAVAGRVGIRHALALVYLQAPCADADIVLQLLQGAFQPGGVVDAAQFDIGEQGDAVFVAVFFDVFHHGFQGRPAAPAEVDDDAHVEAIHLADELVKVLFRHAPVVAVDVDEGEPGSLQGMFRYDEGGGRVVLLKIHVQGSVHRQTPLGEGGDGQ